uniref:ATP synthase F0 subunit 8 n=1 Tax=Basiprionota bisignata TaxID=2873934 RepID=UPI001F135F9A|nr:ATP synthase F0 subunit 8 [Basiprionota bisignata]UKS07057.1 ATP synthase F0 subunit 8 [Basiprionota bisignata]
MPQMAPLNWLMLFMFTIIILMMINCLNYFNYMMNPKLIKNNNKVTLNWKW